MGDPMPYKTIAVASTFSPRFKQVLAEAKRIQERFSADLHLIYVGERNEEIAKKFGDALAQLELPLDSKIHYEKGDPAEAILRALAREKIDVIVAGALEKEVVLHQFLGNVARRLVREAHCSVMLFTRPTVKPRPLRRIVFVADYSDHGLQALKEDALEKFVLSAGATEVPIEVRCIRGNTGLAASDFVQAVKADLLVVPLQKKGAGIAQLPSNIAWVTDVIPCNLWVIR